MSTINVLLGAFALALCFNVCLSQNFTSNAKTCDDCNSTNADCNGKQGYTLCSCKSGFVGNGLNCTRVVFCDNACCPPGYQWDNVKKLCVDVDECKSSSLYTCLTQSQCVNKNGIYLCITPKNPPCPTDICSADHDCVRSGVGNGVKCVDPCVDYQEIDGSSRLYTINSVGRFPTDRYLFGWYRYANGLRLREGYVGALKCGSVEPFSLSSHPALSEGVKSVPLLSNGLSLNTTGPSILVKACPAGYYVYKFAGLLKFEVYCTDSSSATTSAKTTTTSRTTTPTTTTIPTTITKSSTTIKTTTEKTTKLATPATSTTVITTQPPTTKTTTVTTTESSTPTTAKITTSLPATTEITTKPTITKTLTRSLIPTTSEITTKPTITKTLTRALIPTTSEITTKPTTIIKIPTESTTPTSSKATTESIMPTNTKTTNEFSTNTKITPKPTTYITTETTPKPSISTLDAPFSNTMHGNTSVATHPAPPPCENITTPVIASTHYFVKENITVTIVKSKSILSVRMLTQLINNKEVKTLEINETTTVNIKLKSISPSKIYIKMTNSISPTSILILIGSDGPQTISNATDTVITTEESTLENNQMDPDKYCSKPAKTNTMTETSTIVGNTCSKVTSASMTTTITTTEEVIVLGPDGFVKTCADH